MKQSFLQGQLLVRSKVRKDFALKRLGHNFSAAGTCYWCAAGGLGVRGSCSKLSDGLKGLVD